MILPNGHHTVCKQHALPCLALVHGVAEDGETKPSCFDFRRVLCVCAARAGARAGIGAGSPFVHESTFGRRQAFQHEVRSWDGFFFGGIRRK